MQILITGREQELSCAEAEAIFGSVRVLNNQAIAIEPDQPVNINHLGGAIKLASDFSGFAQQTPAKIIEACLEYINIDPPQAKFNFGFSYYGTNSVNLRKLGIELKRSLQRVGLKPRLVQATSDNINAASIKHNKLIQGYEFLLIDDGKQLILARTTATQDVDSYSKRDYEKPCRDSKIGMLPPKLSQILINLARPNANTLVVDPFCGSGGLIIEAVLMGYSADASDLDPAMTECTKANLEWFKNEFSPAGIFTLNDPTDATKRSYPDTHYVIASEGYLGHNFSSAPKLAGIESQLPELKKLYLNFFSHLKTQPTPPARIAICMPFWVVGQTKIELNIIDDITKLGYTKSEFTSVRSPVLEYHRQGQYTGRQILIFNSN